MGEFNELKFKYNESSQIYHSIFLRQHKVREKNDFKPTDRTLFVSGVPSFLNKESLIDIFNHFGPIKNVYLHKTPSPKLPEDEPSKYFKTFAPVTGFKVAYVVFEHPRQMDAALKNEKEFIISKKSTVNGFKKWALEYNERVPSVLEMQQEIEMFMASFDQSDAQKQLKEKEATEMDDEGWITVTKKSRKPGFARKESVVKQLSKKMEKKKQKKELTNFYRFQIKESKMKNLISLREKFEEDKRRIAALKATRRFKPF